MREPPETFDTAWSAWRQWQDSPWGRLRYTQAEANLAHHLPGAGEPRWRVLDLGGGDGGDAIRLAARGHHVTVVDYAPAMLAAARRRARDAGVADRVSLVESDIHGLPPAVLSVECDLVLCHSLLQYSNHTDHIRGATATLAAALAPLRPSGLLSVIAVNRHSEPLHLAVQQNDPAAAHAALGTRQARTHTFGTTMTLYAADEVTAVLDRLCCSTVAHYGIRSVCDYITDNERKQDPAYFAKLQRLELALADQRPYLHAARFFHLIGRKQRNR